MTSFRDVEKFLLDQLDGEFSSLSIEFNRNAPNYQTVTTFIDENHEWFDGCWVSPEEEQKARDTNRLWEIQVYPHTPVGFYNYAASSLEALMDHLMEKKE